MFSAISSSTTIAITPVAPVSAPAPAAPVVVQSSSAGDAALGSGFGGGDTTQFTPSGAQTDDPNAAVAALAPTTAGKAGTAKAAVARIPVTLDAQLMQIENKLAGCINCPSAKTLAGQSQIDALSSQIRQIRQRMLGGDADAAYSVVPPPIGLNLDTCV